MNVHGANLVGEERIKKLQRVAKTYRKMGFAGVAVGIVALGFDVATLLFMPELMSPSFSSSPQLGHFIILSASL